MSSESPDEARALGPFVSFPPDNDGWSMTPAPYGAFAGDPGPEWVALPAGFTETRWADSSAYAEDIATALVVRQRELLGDRNIADDLHSHVADQIRDSCAQLFDLVPAHFHLLDWPDLRKPPVPVFVGFWQPVHDDVAAAYYYSGSLEYSSTPLSPTSTPARVVSSSPTHPRPSESKVPFRSPTGTGRKRALPTFGCHPQVRHAHRTGEPWRRHDSP
jgi:hypothetical protein